MDACSVLVLVQRSQALRRSVCLLQCELLAADLLNVVGRWRDAAECLLASLIDPPCLHACLCAPQRECGKKAAREHAAHWCCSRKVMQLLGGRPASKLPGLLQRYYPQCAACSGKQSAAVKAARPTLVLHYYGMRPWYYAGACCWHSVPSQLVFCALPYLDCIADERISLWHCLKSLACWHIQALSWACGTTVRPAHCRAPGGGDDAVGRCSWA